MEDELKPDEVLPTSNTPQRAKFSTQRASLSWPWASTLIFILSTSISSFVVILALRLNSLSQPSLDRVVDVDNCTCDCWDGAFKGGYSLGGYKHVYFQMTTGTSLLWLWSAFHFIMLLKFVELATTCVLGSVFPTRKLHKVRWFILFSSCLNFYGLFYNWWSTFNYINDAGLHQPYHILLPTQLFFNITDVISAVTLYSLLQDGKGLPPTPMLLASMMVSATHVILSAWDQGFVHLLTLNGAVLRDAMFLVSDMAGLIAVARFIPGGFRRHGKVLALGIVCLLSSYLILKWVAGYR